MPSIELIKIVCTKPDHLFLGDKIYIAINKKAVFSPAIIRAGQTLSLEKSDKAGYGESASVELFVQSRGFLNKDDLIGSFIVANRSRIGTTEQASISNNRADYTLFYRIIDSANLCTCKTPKLSPLATDGPGQKVQGLLAADIRSIVWDRKNLRVKFLNGDAAIQRNIKETVPIWSQFCGINFIFSDDADSEIRINIDNLGRSNSYMGKDNLTISKDKPTMNFGWFTGATDVKEYHRIVLHEFGHALGLIHEHQQPNAQIKWNRENVYKKFTSPPNSWSKEEVDNNIFARYNETTSNAGQYDSTSIMHYDYPADLFEDGRPAITPNYELSEMDKKFISGIYPKGGRLTDILNNLNIIDVRGGCWPNNKSSWK